METNPYIISILDEAYSSVNYGGNSGHHDNGKLVIN